jgi:hypothetical protein
MIRRGAAMASSAIRCSTSRPPAQDVLDIDAKLSAVTYDGQWVLPKFFEFMVTAAVIGLLVIHFTAPGAQNLPGGKYCHHFPNRDSKIP